MPRRSPSGSVSSGSHDHCRRCWPLSALSALPKRELSLIMIVHLHNGHEGPIVMRVDSHEGTELMTGISVIGPADGEAIQLGPIRMRILEDGITTDHRLGVGKITIPPHTDGPPQHRHASHDESFYVVSGSARFTVGETNYDAVAGPFVMIPPGAPHTFSNPSDETTVLLNTFTPDLYVQYFRDLRDLMVNKELTPDAIVEVMSRYATVPATDFA